MRSCAMEDEFQIVERKGLTHALEFPINFKIEWIKVVLRRNNDMKYWLQIGLVEITKKMIHRVTGYSTLEKKKTIRCLSHEEVEANMRSKWNGSGLSITNISNPLIQSSVRVIAQKFYQSSKLNSVPCMVVGQVWKILMKDNEYDIAELQKLKLVENLSSIRKVKNSMCS